MVAMETAMMMTVVTAEMENAMGEDCSEWTSRAKNSFEELKKLWGQEGSWVTSVHSAAGSAIMSGPFAVRSQSGVASGDGNLNFLNDNLNHVSTDFINTSNILIFGDGDAKQKI